MSCDIQRAAWTAADAQLQTSIQAHSQSVAEAEQAAAASTAAQEAANAAALTATEKAAAAVEAKALVVNDANASGAAYSAYIACLTGGEEAPSGRRSNRNS
jgi:hypothetical protein